MKIFKKIIRNIKDYKTNFFTINQIELTPFSKFLTILFFFTSLWLISMGIRSTFSQTLSPSQKYGYKCERFVSNSKLRITDFKKLGVKSYKRFDDFGSAPVCRKLKRKYMSIIEDSYIQSQISQIQILEQKKNIVGSKIRRLNREYSNMLLEKISKQDQKRSILHSNAAKVKKDLEDLSKKERNLKIMISKKSDILNYPKLKEFKSLVEKSKEPVLSGLERERKYYRFKISMQVFAFVVPIWLLFYLLYGFLTKKKKYIFAKLSFYVSSAAALYGLVELVELIYSVIPKVFLGKIIAFFTSHNMIIVLNVLGILFFLLIFGAIIHKIQLNNERKKLQKDTRVLNVKRGCCFNCGVKYDKKDSFCAFCGEELKTECEICENKIYKYTLYCTYCGGARALKENNHHLIK